MSSNDTFEVNKSLEMIDKQINHPITGPYDLKGSPTVLCGATVENFHDYLATTTVRR